MLAIVGGSVTNIDDLEITYLQAAGATSNQVNDAWMEVFLANGATSTNWNTAANEFLIALGATGTNLPDNWAWFWITNGGVISSASASFAVDTDGDLVSKLLFYSFQEDGTDASGNVSAGTDANVTYSAGKIGNMGTYNGTSSEIAFGNDLDFERNEARSWSFWFSMPAGDFVGTVMAHGGNAAHSAKGWLILQQVTGGVGVFYLSLNGGTSFGTSQLMANAGDLAWDDGTLRHLVITYDGSSNESGVLFYINGVSRAKGPATSDTLAANITNTGTTYIGRDSTGSFMKASVDEIAMFSGVLTANNIADMYNSGSGNVFTPGPA
jgi:hypothetical protein